MVIVDYIMFMYAKAKISLLPGQFMYNAIAKTAANEAEQEVPRPNLLSPVPFLALRLYCRWYQNFIETRMVHIMRR
jgi:hypothetical protein